MPFEVHIKRASNGWIVRFPADVELDTSEQLHVYEDPSTPRDPDISAASSLQAALWAAFGDNLQSKHKAGLVIDVRASRSTEESTPKDCPCGEPSCLMPR